MMRPAVHAMLSMLLLSACADGSRTSSEAPVADAAAELRSFVSGTLELESFRTTMRSDPEPGFPHSGDSVIDYIAPDRLYDRSDGFDMFAIGRYFYWEVFQKPGFFVREEDPGRAMVQTHLALFGSLMAATDVTSDAGLFTFRLPADPSVGNPPARGEARAAAGRLVWLRIDYAQDYGAIEVSLSRFNAVPSFGPPPRSRIVSPDSVAVPCGGEGLPEEPGPGLPVTFCDITTEPPA